MAKVGGCADVVVVVEGLVAGEGLDHFEVPATADVPFIDALAGARHFVCRGGGIVGGNGSNARLVDCVDIDRAVGVVHAEAEGAVVIACC
jgi:hypothetical protein